MEWIMSSIYGGKYKVYRIHEIDLPGEHLVHKIMKKCLALEVGAYHLTDNSVTKVTILSIARKLPGCGCFE